FYFDPVDEFAPRAFFSKSKAWEYEQEFRILLDRSGPFKLAKSAVKEIILGCRAYPELRSYANNHLANGEPRFFQMIENPMEYGLNKQPIQPDTWAMTSFF
ncbi:MAG: DUF2971 domain-containing protein, partial [Planctomycetia bacterium]|nr:DUF2971 domain-containing protein [Planctomycetia bacterium]